MQLFEHELIDGDAGEPVPADLAAAEQRVYENLHAAGGGIDRALAERIYRKYHNRYDGEIQGCCPLIADEIQRAIGGEVVAGYLTWYGGACERSHWWVVKCGAVIDPMGDALLSYEESPGRREEHRDRATFERILPQYEQYRCSEVNP
jgi:hypothetical protein